MAAAQSTNSVTQQPSQPGLCKSRCISENLHGRIWGWKINKPNKTVSYGGKAHYWNSSVLGGLVALGIATQMMEDSLQSEKAPESGHWIAADAERGERGTFPKGVKGEIFKKKNPNLDCVWQTTSFYGKRCLIIIPFCRLMYLTIIPKIPAWGGGNRQTVTRCVSGSHHFTAPAAIRTRSQSQVTGAKSRHAAAGGRSHAAPVLLTTLPLNARREAWEEITRWVSLASFLLSVLILILKPFSFECSSCILTVHCTMLCGDVFTHTAHWALPPCLCTLSFLTPPISLPFVPLDSAASTSMSYIYMFLCKI